MFRADGVKVLPHPEQRRPVRGLLQKRGVGLKEIEIRPLELRVPIHERAPFIAHLHPQRLRQKRHAVEQPRRLDVAVDLHRERLVLFMQHLHLCRQLAEVILTLRSFQFAPLHDDLTSGNVGQFHHLRHALIPDCIQTTVNWRQCQRAHNGVRSM